jgi:hypothetical protein
MMMAAKNKPPNPPAPRPKFQPEKWPEMTAPTPSAHSDHTRACLRSWRLAKYSDPASWYSTPDTCFLLAMTLPPGFLVNDAAAVSRRPAFRRQPSCR